MSRSVRFSRKALSIVLSALMLLTAWVFAAPERAAAANEVTAAPEGNGAWVYFNFSGSASGLVAPTWTSYTPPGYENEQDDIEWPAMTAGSWTVNGQSYNYRVFINRANHRNEGGVYNTHIYDSGLTTNYVAYSFMLDYTRPYDTEYYYQHGTSFIHQLMIYYSSSSNEDAENNIRSRGFTPWGHNFNAGDGSKSKYVHSGYNTTTDPYLAIKKILIADGHPTSVTYGGATYYKPGASANMPQVGDWQDCDLNKGNDGDDLYLMATVDHVAGPPLTALTMAQNGNSATARNNLTNNGYSIATDQSGNYQDTNAGAGGDFNYVGYKQYAAAAVNTDTLRQVYDHRMWIYNNGGSNNTALVNALSTARLVLSDVADGYTIYDQSVIDSCVDLLINAIPTLTVDSDVTANLPAGGDVWYQYTPSSDQNLIFLTHANYDADYERYDGILGTTRSDGQMDGNSTIISLLGMASYQVYHEISLTAGTTYYFKIFGYNHNSSNSGTLPMRLATPVTVTFDATGGTSKSYTLPKGYSTMKLDRTGVSRSGHTLVGWATSTSAQESLVNLKSATISVPTGTKTYYALWSPNNAPTLSVNTDYTATIDSLGEIEYYQFTPDSTGKYLIYGTGSTDSYVLRYDPSAYLSTGSYIDVQDDSSNSSNGNTTGYDFGIGGQQFFMLRELEAGTPYLFGVKYYNAGTGSLPFRFEKVYKVTYNANSGSGGPTGAQDKFYNKNLTLSSSQPTRTGYDFLGWSASQTASSASYSAGGTYSANADAVLYAVWTGSEYTVTLNDQSATAPGTASVTAKYTAAMPSITVPAKTGYTFGGYYDGTNGSGTQYYTAAGASARTWNKTSNETLYAKWIPNTDTAYKVEHYYMNESGTYNTIPDYYRNLTGTTDATVTHSDVKIDRSGFTLDTVKSGTSSVIAADGGLVIKLYYSRSQYTVTFVGNGGAVLKTQTGVYHGTAATAPSAPAVIAVAGDASSHLKFTGWDKPFTSVTCDLTVNAVYENEAHNWGAGTVTTQPSCTEEGVRTFTCSACGLTKTEAEPANGHSPVHHAAVPSTKCTQTGTIEYWSCSGCDLLFSDADAQNVVSDLNDNTYGPHAYAFDSFVWAADGTTAQAKYVCANNTAHVELYDAAMTSAPAAPTCTAAGYTDYTATYDGHTDTNRVAGDAATGHTYAEPAESDWTWTVAADGYTATVAVNCVKNDDPRTLTAVVALTDSLDAGHLTDGYKTYTATATIGDQTFTAEKTDTITAEGHSTVHHDAVPSAKCTETGAIEYWSCSGCDKLFSDENAQNEITDISDGVYGPHSFAFDSFVWAADGTTAKAKYVCANNAEHVELHDAAMTSAATVPTCTAAGYTDYTASYDGHTATNRVAGDAATGHETYAAGEWTWTPTADGYAATLEVNCVKGDDPRTLTAVVTLTDSEDAGHLTDGWKKYTATATIGTQAFTDEKTDTITAEGHSTVHHAAVPSAKCTETGTIEYWSCSGCDALFADEEAQNEITDISDGVYGPHAYAFDSFVWAADGTTAQAKYICANSAEHVELYDADMTHAATAPTCTAAGYTDYTATYDGRSDTNRVAGDAATGHETYAAGEWTWTPTADGYTATLEVNCVKGDDPRTLTASVELTESVGAGHLTDGYKKYTATATIGSQTFTDEKTDTITTEGHTTIHHAAAPSAKCTETGTIEYWSCAGCDALFADEDAQNEITDISDGVYGPHAYAFDSFVWAEDGTTAQAKYICANSAEHVELYDAAMTSAAAAPTCTAAGYTDYTAAYDGHTETNRVAGDAATGHTYAKPEDADWTWIATADGYTATVDVNCVKNDDPQTLTAVVALTDSLDAGHLTDGYKTYTATATIGDQTFTAVKTDVIEAEGHSTVHHAAVPAAKCTETGTIEYWSCSGCDKLFSDENAQNEITDISDGTAGPHDYAFDSFVWAVDGTTAQAKYVCRNSAEHTALYDAEMSADAHGPTCTAAGYTDYTAAYDGHTETKRVAGDAATDHDYEATEWIWAEDNSGATATLVCKNDPTHTRELTAVVTHTEDTATEYEGGVIVYTATATIPGTDITFTDTRTVETAPLGHTHVYGEWIEEVGATCEGAGTLGHYTCSGCGAYFDADYNEIEDLTIPAKGHRWGDPVITFSEDGRTATATRTCANADHPDTKDAAVTGEVTKSATCTEVGETTYTATAEFDGVTYTDTKTVADVPALQHSWSEPVFTFSEDGRTAAATRTCANADHPETKAAAVTSEVTTPATCTGRGKTTYTAAVVFDGETYTATKTVEDVAANGHSWDGGAVLTEPTCTGAGVFVYTCAACGATREETLGALGHDWNRGEVTKPATTTETGVRTYTCSRCGETRTETIGKLGACPICNAPHNKNLLDRIVGLIHSIIYFLVTFNRTF